MVSYRIVAIDSSFEDTPKLTTPRCREYLQQKVAPYICDKTLILLEGLYYEGLITTQHHLYEMAYRWCGLDLQHRPTFAGVDPRHRDLSPEAYEKYVANAARWENFTKKRIFNPWVPSFKSTNEVYKLLGQNSAFSELTHPTNCGDRELARWVQQTNAAFDRHCIDTMQNVAAGFDLCILVVDVPHAISIALQTEFPITFASSKTLQDMYYDYVRAYEFPTLVAHS